MADLEQNYLDLLAYYGLHVKVREIREQHHLSQADLARRAGIPHPRLCEKEKGKRRWTLVDLLRISAVLQVPLWELLVITWPMPRRARGEAKVIQIQATISREKSQQTRARCAARKARQAASRDIDARPQALGPCRSPADVPRIDGATPSPHTPGVTL